MAGPVIFAENTPGHCGDDLRLKMQDAWQVQQNEVIACGFAYAVSRCYMLQILEVSGAGVDEGRAKCLEQLWDLCSQPDLINVDFVLRDMDNWIHARWHGRATLTDPQLTDCFCSMAELLRAVAYDVASEFEEGRLLQGFQSLNPMEQLHVHDVWIREEANAHMAIMQHFEWSLRHQECLVGRVKRRPVSLWKQVSRGVLELLTAGRRI